MQVKTVRKGATRIDYGKGEIILRKPATSGPSDLPLMQIKRDGQRVIVARQLTQHFPSVFTTVGLDLSDTYIFDKWDWYLRAMYLPPGGFLDGELYIPGKGREAVKTALVNSDPALRFAIFGTNVLPADSSLYSLNKWLGASCLESLRYTKASDTAVETASDCDGVVMKDTMYGTWVKIKNRKTVDCVVTGIRPGIGKYWGMCGSLEVSLGARPIAHVSGMNDDVRCAIDKEDIGRVCEIAYERVGSKGRLQHPRFIAWRDDKLAADCTEDQL